MQLKDTYVHEMKSLLGQAGFLAYQSALLQPAQRGLRYNLLAWPDGRPPLEDGLTGDPVPWAEGAFYVPEQARPGLSPLHEAGAFYLQEPSAMAPVSALSPLPGERVLDLCAAPGGKSTQIAGLMQGQGVLVCNEPVYSRAQILSRNLERMGVSNAVAVSAKPEQLAPRFEEFFDRILVDAPCSGEGMFRRHPEAMEEWDEQAPGRCAERQSGILDSASKMLRPGGRLVYSTCTFSRAENEDVIRAFLARHPDFCAVSFTLPGLPDAPQDMLRLYPHEIRGEGHFVACLEKDGGASAPMPEIIRGKTAAAELLPPVFARSCALRGSLRRIGDALVSLPDIDLGRLDGIRILRAGLRVAQLRGNRAEPDHALAMALRPEDAALSAQLTPEQALLYQAGETLDLGEVPAGYTLLCCRGKSLGWGKQAGGLMKNHYPKGLRRRQDSLLSSVWE